MVGAAASAKAMQTHVEADPERDVLDFNEPDVGGGFGLRRRSQAWLRLYGGACCLTACMVGSAPGRWPGSSQTFFLALPVRLNSTCVRAVVPATVTLADRPEPLAVDRNPL
jgi:hypothetical protein